MWFSKFLNSPYFNNKKKILILYNNLRKFHPEYDARNFSKEHLFKLIYGNTNYNDSTFRNLMSDLLKLMLQFLKMEGIEKNELETSFFLTQELYNRGASNLFLNQMSKNENYLNSRKVMDGLYFLSKYRIETDRFSLNLLTQKTTKKSDLISESQKLIEGIIYILCYFITESLQRNDLLLNYSRSYNINKNIDTVSEFLSLFNFDKILSYISKNMDLEVPVIGVYSKMLKVFIEIDNKDAYSEFKKSLLQHSKELGSNNNYFFYTKLIDYCVIKKNLGSFDNSEIDREIFELQSIYIKNEYYKTEANSYLAFDVYRNVLINSIAVKELDYMEDFIIKYSKKLLPKYKSNMENYSYALLYFEKNNFDKALNCLNKVKFDQFVYKLDMKNLQLKINFELEYFESAISVIDTYKHFLNNSPLLSENRKISHNNYLAYTLKLIHFKTGSKKINIPFLGDKISKTKNVFDKIWLLEKIKESAVYNI